LKEDCGVNRLVQRCEMLIALVRARPSADESTECCTGGTHPALPAKELDG
jgi:hypothetical protein